MKDTPKYKNAAQQAWMLEELHKLRAFADIHGLEATSETLRVAIIANAQELNLPTGLKVEDLIYGMEPKPFVGVRH